MTASQALNDVRLPRAIVRQSDAIKARLEARQGSETVTDLNTPAEPAPSATPPAADLSPTPPAPAADPRHSTVEYWMQRFKVTEGLLRAEREAHAATARDKGQRIAELEAQVSTLQAGATPPETIDLAAYFTPEQIDKYGEEQCQVMARAARAAADEQARKLIEAQIAPLKQQREDDAKAEAQRRKTAFTDRLIELVPNYAEIDVSPGWLTWLAQEDATTQLVRQEILNRHVGRMNADAVAGMFQQYLAASKPPLPPVAPNGTAAPVADAPPVAPTPAVAGGHPSAAEKRGFYKRAALGKVSDQERASFEARLKLPAGR